MRRPRALRLILGFVATLFLTMTAQAFAQEPTKLYVFKCSADGCRNGSGPLTPIQGSDGNLYGVTIGGGKFGEGTIFKLTPSGQHTLLYNFSQGPGGPTTLVEGSDGNLYGATFDTGNDGFVFKIGKNGSGFQILHKFVDTIYGEAFSNESLTLGKDGNVYGSSQGGGLINVCAIGCGTIFSINVATGVFTTLYELNGTTDGSDPSGLVQASDGNFYGMTQANGTTPNNLFRVTPTGTYTVVTQLPANARLIL